MAKKKTVKQKHKIFGIGMSRTGTSSLAKAMTRLGYNFIHYPQINELLDLDESVDGANAAPVAVLFKTLDRVYPDSKFILTTQNVDAWITSCERHIGGKDIRGLDPLVKTVRALTYGRMDYHRQTYITSFKLHDFKVRAYFKSRPKDLLVMDIGKGDGWKKLVPFLGLDVDVKSLGDFPWENKHKIN